ncbi:MAG: zinc ribbon domain-containing protein [Thermoleophilia bacterium]
MSLRFRDVLRRLLVVVGFAVAFAMVIMLIYPHYGLAFSLLIMLVLAVFLVRAYSMGYRYRCAGCGHRFKVPLLVDFLTFSGMGRNPDGTYHTWKSLTCPSCGRRTRAVAVRMGPDASDDTGGTPQPPTRRPAAPKPAGKGRGPQRRGGRTRQ